jgi:5-formyltetrahydrofolate cyclo-ligase
VDTTAIVEGLSAMGKVISVPVIRDGSLCSASFRQGDPLRPAQFGQPEPEIFSMADESELDVVLLPLLAFDARGYRLGYGKGFYDRFLQRLSQQGRKVCRIGLSFSLQMVEEVPADQWDETLDGVVHEQGIIRFA